MSELRADPIRGALAIQALLDPQSDPDRRFNGALLVHAFMRDVALIRKVFWTVDGD